MTEPYPDALEPVIVALVNIVRSRHWEDGPQWLDQSVQTVLRDVGLAVAQRLFADAARQAIEDAKSDMRARGWEFHIERSPSVTFQCLFGPVSVVSPYLRPSEPPPPVSNDTPFLEDTPPRGLRPVNDALGVRGGGKTPRLQRVVADFGLDNSFEVAANKLKEHYGLELHRTSIRRTTLKQGEAAEWNARSRPHAPDWGREPGPPLLVEMDGSCVRTGELVPSGTAAITPKRKLPKRKRTTAWRDLRLAFVRRLDGREAVFVGGILPLDEVADRLRDEAGNFGWTKETVTVHVTDGGHGVREALDRAFPSGVHILDRPHLHHHLFEAAHAMGLADDEAKRHVLDWSRRLARGQADTVIADFAAYEGRGEERVAQLAGYLDRFRTSVRYEEFERLGYPTGSGEIESAHKGQVQARLKLRGTWWTCTNANRLLALRLCRANGRWDEHWKNAA